MSQFLSTRVSISLSLVVTVQDGHHTSIATRPLVDLSLLAGQVYKARLTVKRIKREVAATVNDLAEAMDFTGKALAIGFRSLAFGLGVAT